jgi:hypothetical protein
MASLKIRSGSKHETAKGTVEIEGICIVLRELNPKTGVSRIVFAYCLQPGETVTRGEGDDYVVEL